MQLDRQFKGGGWIEDTGQALAKWFEQPMCLVVHFDKAIERLDARVFQGIKLISEPERYLNARVGACDMCPMVAHTDVRAGLALARFEMTDYHLAHSPLIKPKHRNRK